MSRRRHTPEQIVRKLREADRMLTEGADLAAQDRHLEVSEQTYHRWRNQYGGRQGDPHHRRLVGSERESEVDPLIGIEPIAKQLCDAVGDGGELVMVEGPDQNAAGVVAVRFGPFSQQRGEVP
jgi:hypothetical protein